MRAALVSAWPALSKHFGLHPWDIPRLSMPELNSYLDALADMAAEAQRTRPTRRR